MSNNSPTCILSSSCLQGPPHAGHHHQQIVATISAEVESPSRDSLTTDRNRCLFLDRSRSPCSLPDIKSSSCSQNTPFLQTQDTSSGRYGGSSQGTQKSTKSSKISAWKTSKFFSKSMTSGEILRGLKKLSLTSSSEDGESKSSSAPSLRSRFTNLKKRSSYGSEDVSIDVEPPATLAKAEQKAASRPPSLGDSATSQKSSQDDGIVCKKEDLKAILSGASKRASTPRRTQLRQTKSASFEPAKDDIKKGTVRRTGSEESRPRKCKSVDSEEHQSAVCRITVECNEVFDDTDTGGTVAMAEVSSPTKKQTVASTAMSSSLISAEENVSTVKWDESEVVDAGLIGDAIENFLKGSMSGSERRVSFRKS